MDKKFEAWIEIVKFECDDIITASPDHDNGYVVGGGLAYVAEDIVNKIGKLF